MARYSYKIRVPVTATVPRRPLRTEYGHPQRPVRQDHPVRHQRGNGQTFRRYNLCADPFAVCTEVKPERVPDQRADVVERKPLAPPSEAVGWRHDPAPPEPAVFRVLPFLLRYLQTLGDVPLESLHEHTLGGASSGAVPSPLAIAARGPKRWCRAHCLASRPPGGHCDHGEPAGRGKGVGRTGTGARKTLQAGAGQGVSRDGSRLSRYLPLPAVGEDWVPPGAREASSASARAIFYAPDLLCLTVIREADDQTVLHLAHKPRKRPKAPSLGSLLTQNVTGYQQMLLPATAQGALAPYGCGEAAEPT